MSNIMYHYDIEQGSIEWRDIKRDKMSASRATPIRVGGSGLVTYAREIALDILSISTPTLSNSDLDRGSEYEPEALSAYKMITGYNSKVKTVGFVENRLYAGVGCSPDAIIPSIKGGAEIKARNAVKHLSLIDGCTKEIPEDQIQMTLLLTESEWWDFISYNPDFKFHPLFIKRIYPDKNIFRKLMTGFVKGTNLIQSVLDNHNDYKLPKF